MLFKLFKYKETRDKILFTLFCIIIFRVGSHLPVPGVNPEVLKFGEEGGLLNIFNTFAGGALQQYSIFAMGIMPYISASIIMQLLQMDIVPTFTEWGKQGDFGQKNIQQFTRMLAMSLAFVQSIMLSIGFNRVYTGLIINPSTFSIIGIALVLTAGTAFLMWLSDQITQYGIGNGISIIILTGIVSRLPVEFMQVYESQIGGAENKTIAILYLVIVLIVALLLIALVVFVQEGIRKIPVQYSQVVKGKKLIDSRATFLPIKANAAGIIPVIFAVTFLQLPNIIGMAFQDNLTVQRVMNYLSMTHPFGMVIYSLLIIGFCYFYVLIQVNPEKIADKLNKQGSFIPGIRPGNNTEKYIKRVLYRLTFVSSIFMVVISIFPTVAGMIFKLPQSIQIGGTSLIITVSVVLETVKQLITMVNERRYRGFY